MNGIVIYRPEATGIGIPVRYLTRYPEFGSAGSVCFLGLWIRIQTPVFS
jgi:hypothetical protein